MTKDNQIRPDNAGPEEEDFASLFENYMSDVKDDLRVGEEITGEIISVGNESVFINTGTKVDGVVEKAELIDENGELPYKTGDKLKLYVIGIGEGELRLSKAFTGAGDPERLHDAKRNSIPVEGRVTETCKGGFRVNILGKSAFCPVSQIDIVYVENPETYVGSVLEFLITRIESGGKNIVVSRRELLNRYIAQEREKFIKNVAPGDIIDARITRLMSYGAFAEVAPGVEGMIHISELSWTRVHSPEEAVSVGDTVKAKLLGVEKPQDPTKTPKISLSVKQALGDPWHTILDRYKEGDKVEGTVTRCADFGAFVEIEPGIEGLVHISEISHKRVNRTEDELSPGQKVFLVIKSIDPTNRRLSLSMKDVEGDPWISITDNYEVGQQVTGRIENKEKFGYFVALQPGIVGLLPVSKIKDAPSAKEIENLRTGDNISVVIESIDTRDRKISLAPADSTKTGDWKKYQDEKPSAAGLGALGEKLQAALKSKE